MARRRWFRFVYPAPVRRDRQLHPFLVRDGDAAQFLSEPLYDRGYRFADLIYNFPSPGPDIIAVDESYLREDDLIVLTTRPPINDWEIEGRRGIPRSYTSLEQKIFQALQFYLATCSRSEIVLTEEAAMVSPMIAERQSMVFRKNGGAMYQNYGSPITKTWHHFGKSQRSTATFLVYFEHAWPGGPGLLAAWGVGGTETLVWCKLLASRFSDLLLTTPFAMGELTGKWPKRPETSDFADTLNPTILGPLKKPMRAA